ncbi:MAG TPA: serine/threonine-protein kinase [Gemmatimonadales bacterium]
MRREFLPQVQKAVDGKYVVEREVARGGAARVFVARDLEGRQVALKVLHPQLAVSVTADRFLREISLLSQMDHPRMTRLIDYGEGEYLVYYVMEFVEGPSLRTHLDRAKQTSLSDTIHIADNLLDALDYAHGKGLVHRDVKPENILLDRKGAVLVDFGIARAVVASGTDRLTRSGFAVGTSAYMSPEQVEGSLDIDHRSDIYSLGCVLFECLAGRPPFMANREEVVLRMHLKDHAPDAREFRKETPDGLAELILRAMANRPDGRFQTAAAMREALMAVVDS